MDKEKTKIESFRDKLVEITLGYLERKEPECMASVPALLKAITDLTVEIGDA